MANPAPPSAEPGRSGLIDRANTGVTRGHDRPRSGERRAAFRRVRAGGGCVRGGAGSSGGRRCDRGDRQAHELSLIHISEPTRLGMISYAVFCLKKKKKK